MPGNDGELDLIRLLDVLIPAFDGLPGAGGLGLAPSVASDAAANPRFADALALVLDALAGSPFRESDVRSVAERKPEAFADVVNLAYTNYYTEPRVLAVVERNTGYRAEPPQPNGYDLAPFDPSLLDNVRHRAARLANQCTEPGTLP